MPANQSNSSNETGDKSVQAPTPELVQQVTDRVYKLFLKDLKCENERRRIRNPHYRR